MHTLTWGILTIAGLVASMVTGGCGAAHGAKAPRFAVYAVAEPVDLVKREHGERVDLATLKLAPQPLLSDDDVVAYEWATHRITLKPEAFARLPTGPGLGGEPFVVMADGQRCYLAAFWSRLSSLMPHGPVCYLGPLVKAEKQGYVIKIEAPPTAGEPDTRGDKRVRQALASLGKLR